MLRPAKAVVLACLLMVIPVAPAQAEEPDSTACPSGFQTMPGVGLVCPAPDGLYEVFNADLESLGFIHGTDPAPAAGPAGDEPLAALGGTSVNCVSGAAGTYFIQVIYARAFDDTDGYASWLSTIRTMTGNANKLVDDAAIATGGTASLNVKCVAGVVEVKNEVLPTGKLSASFSTVVTDLKNKGYNDGKVKYWVLYDDTGACSCGGTGHVYSDDSLSAGNLNNGNGAALFAVTFGYNSVNIWLHELGHNMGAVQNSAPHSTRALHCYDGRDTMCYNDGGVNGTLYSTSYCSVEVFDCGKNDYFNRNPAPGSYLATRWNLGNTLNRFIYFGPVTGPPTMVSLSCSPTTVLVGATVTCSYRATDPDSTGVRYTINWGDASTTVDPSGSTYTTPGVTRSASHAYGAPGVMTVTVSVVDNNGQTGNSMSVTVGVGDVTAPSLTVQDPAPGSVYVGCTRVPLAGAVLAWVDSGCVRATATDAGSGMNRVEVLINGILRASDSTAPYEIVVPVPTTTKDAHVTVRAVDNAGNAASQLFFVHMLAT